MSTDQINDQQTTDQQPSPAPLDMDVLMQFVGQVVGDLGATISAGNVVIGERLGLYRALAAGPADARALAAATGTDERYVEEWLRGQAAGGYVEHDATTGVYSMTTEKAFALTDPDRAGVPPRRLRAGPRGAQGRVPRSRRRSAPARATAGTGTTARCSPGASGSSDRAT